MKNITIEEIDKWFIDSLSSDKYYIYGLYHDDENDYLEDVGIDLSKPFTFEDQK